MRKNRIIKQLIIKSKHELENFKKREANHIEGTLKIIFGKMNNDVQEIFFDQYVSYPLQELRDFLSNEIAFDFASLIIKATHKLALVYGNFILNENMVFKTVLDEELFIWINPDLFINQPKIYLPESHQGQLAMIKSLINYFKLWLQTDFTILSQTKTLEELEFKILSLRNKNYSNSNAANSTKVESQNKKSNTSSQNFVDKYSCKSKNIGRYTPSEKGPEFNQNQKGIKNKLQFKQIFSNHVKNSGLSSKHSDYDFEKNNDFLQLPQPNSAVCRTTGTTSKKYFPFKTTSANSKKILSLIKKADDNPDQYVSNNIKMTVQQLKQLQQIQKQRNMKQSLNEVGEQLDNLFMSNMREEKQNFNKMSFIEREFSYLLG